MNSVVAAACLLFFSIVVCAQSSPAVSPGIITGNGNTVAAKNYYLLSLLQHDKAVSQLLAKDPALKAMLADRKERMSKIGIDCKDSVACFIKPLIFAEDEISQISGRLAALYANNNVLEKLVKRDLIPSGNYILFRQLAPKEILLKAWEQDARGINFAIGVYAAGRKANYPNIDSISFNVQDRRYLSLLYDAVYSIGREASEANLFFEPSLIAALRFLEINERNNAADYEPMRNAENKTAAERIKTIAWASYPYSVIMIPGAGPEELTVALSAEGMIRCRLAALQFRKGLAPFIVASGGKVHPYKTRFCEAIEMKKYLVETLHIPASAVLIDPHARHTTTNMRNTVRLIYRYGIPFTKPALTCTTRGQSSMIEGTLISRCLKELNEAPYKNGRRLSETEMEFYPLIEALQINPLEPMDP